MNEIYKDIKNVQHEKIPFVVGNFSIHKKPYTFSSLFRVQETKLKEVREDLKNQFQKSKDEYEKKVLRESETQYNIIINSLSTTIVKKYGVNVNLGLNLAGTLNDYKEKVNIIQFKNSNELEFGSEDIKGINTSLKNKNKNFIFNGEQYNIEEIKNNNTGVTKNVKQEHINLHTNFLRQFEIEDAEEYEFNLEENTINYIKLNLDAKEFVPKEYKKNE